MFKVKKYKLGRRLGSGVFEKCQTPKFAASNARRRSTDRRRSRTSDYGQQLIKKQQVRYMYGLSEKQFENYVKRALHTNTPPQALFEQVESRLDNVAYRMGLAPTRRMARQMASHGHFTVNGKRINVPSHIMKKGDILSIREGSKSSPMFSELKDRLATYTSPGWVTFDLKSLKGEVTGTPINPDPFLDFKTVIEFYTR